MSMPSVIPVQFRHPWIPPSGDGMTTSPAKNSGSGSHSLSLEVAKGIWRKYPTLDTTAKKPAPASSSTVKNSNVLELNLGIQSQSGDRETETIASHRMSQTQTAADPPGMNGEAGVSDADARMDSPTSEFAVDELLPTASDAMDITPAIISNSLPSEPRDARGVQPLPPSPSPRETYEHSLAQVRAALMDSFHKTVQMRYPDQDIDRAKLSERFAQKLSDAEVQDFVRMGKEVVDQLRDSGKLEEAKRKYFSEGRDEDDGGPRPGVGGSSSPDEADASRPYHSERDHSREPEIATPTPSERPVRAATPKAPRAMLANNWMDPPPSLPDPVPPHDSTESREAPAQRLPTPGHDSPGDVAMSIEPSSPRIVPSGMDHTHESNAPDPSDDQGSGMEQDQSQSFPGEPEGQGESVSRPGANLPPEMSPGSARILLATAGMPSGDVVDASFDLDEALVVPARRWAQRSDKFDPTASNMRIYLTCIPKVVAETAHNTLPPDYPPSLLAETMSQHPVAWPQQGTYYVSLNRGRPEAASWSDRFFTPSSPPLDLSGVVLPGKNDIQFVQLADHSQLLFVILAIPPSEAETQEVLAMHSRRTAWNQVIDDYKPKTGIKLRLGALSC